MLDYMCRSEHRVRLLLGVCVWSCDLTFDHMYNGMQGEHCDYREWKWNGFGNHCNRLYFLVFPFFSLSILVTQGVNVMTLKGCTTKNNCNITLLNSHGLIITDVECCEGNLCNDAENFMLSFLLMFVPLLSTVLFYWNVSLGKPFMWSYYDIFYYIDICKLQDYLSLLHVSRPDVRVSRI